MSMKHYEPLINCCYRDPSLNQPVERKTMTKTINLRLLLLLLLFHSAWITIILYSTLVTLQCSAQFHNQKTLPTNHNYHVARPKFTLQPEDQDVEQGNKVQIKCVGEGSPSPMLFWYKEGHRQLMFAPPNIATTNTIPQQQPLLTKQQHLLTDWPQAAPLVAATVSDYRPGVGLLPSPLSASDTSPSINKLFTMPTDQLSSYSNNYFGNRIYVDKQGTLNIVNVTASDSGYYACALISSVGSVMAKAKLTVRHLPNSQLGASDYFDPASLQDPLQARSSHSILSSNKFDLLPPPVIKFGASNQTLPTNTSTNLNCEVVSLVQYKIQWYFESQPLQEDPGRVTVLDSGALSILNLRTSDSGVYTCVVTAAQDQVMPLANPYEPLDSSMLTSAPPIQQSTLHSTMLRVASPMNPNIQFYRMDSFAYPSQPGPAYLVPTKADSTHDRLDAITIAWAAPGDSGSLPIKEYVVEHYDTSQEHFGWREIYRVKGKESLHIDGLSADGSHFFVIRAANSHGTGPSSAIAGPFRTVAGDLRYQSEIQKRRNPTDSKKINFEPSNNIRAETNLARERLMSISTNLLNLTPISSTSIRLQWSTEVTGNFSGIPSSESVGGINFPLLSAPDVDNFLEGYSIRYRAIGIGESLSSKNPLFGANFWSPKEGVPSSLPLVTSYIDEESDKSPLNRNKRDLPNYFDYSQEFNEVRVVDHNTEHYTINGLKPFTLYQFFVVPYYKDIDGVPSNILTAQTNEDRPSIAPPYFMVEPINNTAVRLLWLHVPPSYSNGIIQGYIIRMNRSDISDTGIEQQSPEAPKIFNLPIGNLSVALLTPFSKQTSLVSMYEVTNLTYKSFYSVQIAAATNAGSGPLSDPQNFIMDPKILAQQKIAGSQFDEVMSKSLIGNQPQSYGNLTTSNGVPSVYLIVSFTLGIMSILLGIGFLLYRRNNQKVTTWKKTISEHFTNKFYMPSNVDHRQNSIQQNIYDHQQHLIYAGSAHVPQQSIQSQTMWGNNACINSSGTGSLSSHGGLLPISNDPNSMARRISNGEQVLLMNNKDPNARFAKNNVGQLVNPPNADLVRSMNQAQNQIMNHGGDYYSVINNAAEYEELDPQRRNNMQMVTSNADRHMTASSNSDTSCPSSVTRLLPNQNYNRDLLNRTFGENQRHEMVLQQQIGCNEGKQPFATMINGDATRLQQQSIVPLSPYATTNLMNQGSMPQQLLANQHPMSLIDHSRQQNFIMHNGGGAGLTMDDSSKALMNQQHMNGAQNPMSVFRTLQRNPINSQFQQRGQQFTSTQQPQVFMQADGNVTRFNNHNFPGQFQTSNSIVANITTNPLANLKPNLYEHVGYSDTSENQQHSGGAQRFTQLQQQVQQQPQQFSQASNDVISSSTSSGSMKSSPDQQSNKFNRRGSAQTSMENESHDLRVFSSVHVSRHSDSSTNEKQRLNKNDVSVVENGNCDEDEEVQADETTAFRQLKSSQSDGQRTRQLSKRKRQQQRNRLHNNNQKIG